MALQRNSMPVKIETKGNELLKKYFNLLANSAHFKPFTIRAKRFYLDFLFKDVSFYDKSVLDIGAGSGMFSIFAAIMGAKRVVSLEPQEKGSIDGNVRKFEWLSRSLAIKNIYLKQIRFQDFDGENQKYEIILLHNSINHLDEKACIRLHTSYHSRKIYGKIFEKLSRLATPGAELIVTDCSNDNFFGSLGITNPFARTIDWNKHHPPEFWSARLWDYGFRNPRIRWTSFSGLQEMGKIFLGNRFASFFLTSHFILTMDKLS